MPMPPEIGRAEIDPAEINRAVVAALWRSRPVWAP